MTAKRSDGSPADTGEGNQSCNATPVVLMDSEVEKGKAKRQLKALLVSPKVRLTTMPETCQL